MMTGSSRFPAGTCPTCGQARDWQGSCPRCVILSMLAPGPVEAATPGLPEESRRFGRFELIEEVGRGGMGRVWKAREGGLDRVVALKLLAATAQADVAARERFRREALAAGRLRHPGVVTVHEVGEAEGAVYLAMDFVSGGTLADRLKEGPLAGRAAARLVREIADAVHHAHEKGVLHRDLKPSNILLEDGRVDRPRLVDFGIARLVGSEATLTHTHESVGTPAYLAPEQCSGRRVEQGPATDVHGLGGVLFHCLTGRAPFLGDSPAEVLRAVIEHEPPSPRVLNPSVTRDLETVCLKCLEKSVGRRYPSAAEVREDLDRVLDGRPIRARPVGVAEHGWRWARRHPAAGTAVVLALVGLGVVLEFWRRAEAASDALKREMVRSENIRAQDNLKAGRAVEALAGWARSQRRLPGDAFSAARLISALSGRSWPRPVLELGDHPGHLVGAAWSPDGRVILTACADGLIRRWKADGGERLDGHWSHPGDLWSGLAFCPDGRFVVSAKSSGEVRAWESASSQLRLDLPADKSYWTVWRFRPRTAQLAVNRTGGVDLWDLESGRWVRRFVEESGSEPSAPSGAVRELAFDPTGRRLVIAGPERQARVWDAETGRLEGEPIDAGDEVFGVDVDPTGRWMLLTVGRASLMVCEFATGQVVVRLGRAEGSAARFGPDGAVIHEPEDGGKLQSTSVDGMTAGWRLATVGPRDSSSWLLTDDRERLIVFRDDREFEIVSARDGRLLAGPIRAGWPVESVAFDPSGSRLVVCAGRGEAGVWALPSPPTRSKEVDLGDGVAGLEFEARSSLLDVCYRDGTVRRWDPDRSAFVVRSTIPRSRLAGAGFVPGSRRVLAVDDGATAELFEADSGRSAGASWKLPKVPKRLAISADGRWAALGSDSRSFRLLALDRPNPDDAMRSVVPRGEDSDDRLFSVEFDPQSRRFALASYDGRVLIGACREAGAARVLPHAGPVFAARFSPDGRRVATAGGEGVVSLWNVADGRPVGSPFQHGSIVHDLAFSPDGHRLVSSGANGSLRVWKVAGGALVCGVDETEPLLGVAFHPSGGAVASLTMNSKRVGIWDAETGLPWAEGRELSKSVNRARFAPDGRWLVLYHGDGIAVAAPVPWPPGPVPGWLPDLAEAVAGGRLTIDGAVETVSPRDRRALAGRLRQVPKDPRWAGWLENILR